MAEKNDDYVIDFISGQKLRATPEEVQAVQPFARILVDDYGYPKDVIQTRPQWRVRARPSDTKKEYPVDIAVFSDASHSDETLSIVVECKKKTRKDGMTQLQDYMRLSKASMGVWFNGNERLFLAKREHDGKVEFYEIPNIPRYGERLEDIGKFKRKDLRPAESLKSTFKAIRNYLAANAVGITRDEVLASQMINLIFCKIYDERFTKPDDTVRFRAGVDESASNVAKRIKDLFTVVRKQYSDVITKSDSIDIDDRSLLYVVGELQLYSLMESTRDAVGAAFEVFIGPSLKGGQGQFFTPRNVVQMVIDMVDPEPDDKILDPACGSGGFLVEGLRYVWSEIEARGAKYGWPQSEIDSEKQKVAIKNFFGIDKDSFLSKVAKAYLAILGDGRGGIHCENSLEHSSEWSSKTRNDITEDAFDVIITNPPFGKKLAIDSEAILKRYDLGHRWKQAKDGTFEKGVVLDKQPPQILFIERCISLLRPGGRMGIVLPETIFGMPKYRYVVDYIRRQGRIKAVVTLPEDTFQPETHAKCCVVIFIKFEKGEVFESIDPYPIFMCETKWCGHDSRGNPTIKIDERGEQVLMDDIPTVAAEYKRLMSE